MVNSTIKPARAVPLASARQHPENKKENQAGHSSERTVEGHIKSARVNSAKQVVFLLPAFLEVQLTAGSTRLPLVAFGERSAGAQGKAPSARHARTAAPTAAPRQRGVP